MAHPPIPKGIPHILTLLPLTVVADMGVPSVWHIFLSGEAVENLPGELHIASPGKSSISPGRFVPFSPGKQVSL